MTLVSPIEVLIPLWSHLTSLSCGTYLYRESGGNAQPSAKFKNFIVRLACDGDGRTVDTTGEHRTACHWCHEGWVTPLMWEATGVDILAPSQVSSKMELRGRCCCSSRDSNSANTVTSLYLRCLSQITGDYDVFELFGVETLGTYSFSL